VAEIEGKFIACGVYYRAIKPLMVISRLARITFSSIQTATVF